MIIIKDHTKKGITPNKTIGLCRLGRLEEYPRMKEKDRLYIQRPKDEI